MTFSPLCMCGSFPLCCIRGIQVQILWTSVTFPLALVVQIKSERREDVWNWGEKEHCCCKVVRKGKPHLHVLLSTLCPGEDGPPLCLSPSLFHLLTVLPSLSISFALPLLVFLNVPNLVEMKWQLLDLRKNFPHREAFRWSILLPSLYSFLELFSFSLSPFSPFTASFLQHVLQLSLSGLLPCVVFSKGEGRQRI